MKLLSTKTRFYLNQFNECQSLYRVGNAACWRYEHIPHVERQQPANTQLKIHPKQHNTEYKFPLKTNRIHTAKHTMRESQTEGRIDRRDGDTDEDKRNRNSN